MKWYQFAENPQALDSLYETVPGLGGVDLFGISLDREGSQIRLRFNLSAFPNNPPTRWHKDFNTVEIQLSFWGVTEFEAKGWQSEMKVKIAIKRHDKVLEVFITNPEMDLRYRFLCEFFRIERVTPYQNQ